MILIFPFFVPPLQYSTLFILVGLLGILNYEGILYDSLGYGEEVEKLVDSTDEGYKNETKALASMLNISEEFPYDWRAGKVVYIVSLSAIFMGTIILEVSAIFLGCFHSHVVVKYSMHFHSIHWRLTLMRTLLFRVSLQV
jgi:hypothetical protein